MSWLSAIGSFLKPIAGGLINSFAPGLIDTIGSAVGNLTNTVGDTGTGLAKTVGDVVGNLGQRFGGDSGRSLANQFTSNVGRNIMGGMQNKICAEERIKINDLENRIRSLQGSLENNNKRQRPYTQNLDQPMKRIKQDDRYDFERQPQEEDGQYYGNMYNE